MKKVFINKIKNTSLLDTESKLKSIDKVNYFYINI